jgi:outer membrane protein OmpA-like peptidoglycan-associated protein
MVALGRLALAKTRRLLSDQHAGDLPLKLLNHLRYTGGKRARIGLGEFMRRLALMSLLFASVPAAAVAQSGATRSAQDYVCALTDECEEQAEEAPSESVGTKGRARTSATRGFSLTKPGAKPAARPVTTGAAPRAATATATPRATAKPAAKKAQTAMAVSKPKAAIADRRVDLRLSFQLGSAELTPQAMEEAKVFAQALQMPALSARKFLIEGHTDAQGSRAYNLDLSHRRAKAVADYLASLGVSRDRFDVRGYGFDKPLPGRSAVSQDNRRVEAVLTS